jgi:hypothetical protein
MEGIDRGLGWVAEHDFPSIYSPHNAERYFEMEIEPDQFVQTAAGTTNPLLAAPNMREGSEKEIYCLALADLIHHLAHFISLVSDCHHFRAETN